MLGYRHAFHAGNHADVLKHLVLMLALERLCAKDKPLWYIDTHAGAGRYRLGSGVAAGHEEYGEGIGKLWGAADLPAPLARYRELVRGFNPGGKLRCYPGSPALADALLRRGDRLWLHELHPADAAALAREFKDHADRARVIAADGFDGLRALLPPQPRRALVLIDPSYELAEDYRRVPKALGEALQRFATGVYAVWYPLLARRESRLLVERLQSLGAAHWLHARLEVRRAIGPDSGLHGSGLFIVNPPFGVAAALRECTAALRSLLEQRPGEGDFRVEAGESR